MPKWSFSLALTLRLNTQQNRCASQGKVVLAFVRVAHRRWLQGHVSIETIKDGHWVVVHTEDVVNVAQYVGIIPKVVSRPDKSRSANR